MIAVDVTGTGQGVQQDRGERSVLPFFILARELVCGRGCQHRHIAGSQHRLEEVGGAQRSANQASRAASIEQNQDPAMLGLSAEPSRLDLGERWPSRVVGGGRRCFRECQWIGLTDNAVLGVLLVFSSLSLALIVLIY
jgi:hypothetical protein